jgi:CheY-like chemotaxis protein
VTRRVLIAEPNDDVRTLLELTVRRLGYEPVDAEDSDERPRADAVLLEPGCAVGQAVLARFGEHVPPVVCLSIYPREAQLAPPETVAYLVKPATTDALAAALSDAFWR